ncbi:arylamine N-acetyltransferase, partial [Burkholderia sp. SIMBA_024]
SRPTENGRVTLSENKLIITEDHQRHESTLHAEDERRATLMRYFGIDLDR